MCLVSRPRRRYSSVAVCLPYVYDALMRFTTVMQLFPLFLVLFCQTKYLLVRNVDAINMCHFPFLPAVHYTAFALLCRWALLRTVFYFYVFTVCCHVDGYVFVLLSASFLSKPSP